MKYTQQELSDLARRALLLKNMDPGKYSLALSRVILETGFPAEQCEARIKQFAYTTPQADFNQAFGQR